MHRAHRAGGVLNGHGWGQRRHHQIRNRTLPEGQHPSAPLRAARTIPRGRHRHPRVPCHCPVTPLWGRGGGWGHLGCQGPRMDKGTPAALYHRRHMSKRPVVVYPSVRSDVACAGWQPSCLRDCKTKSHPPCLTEDSRPNHVAGLGCPQHPIPTPYSRTKRIDCNTADPDLARQWCGAYLAQHAAVSASKPFSFG